MPEKRPSGSALESASPPATLGWPVAYVAARVGVSISTLRSWERRYGLGPSGRTEGGHRRYTTDDIAAMLRLRRFVAEGMSTSAAAVAVRGTPSTSVTSADDPLEQQFLLATDALDAAGVASAVRALLVERGAVSTWTDVVTPFLQRLGAEWAGTGTGIECEHIAVAAIMSAFDRWTFDQRQTSPGGRAVLAAVQHDQHTAPLHALAAALAERNIEPIVLGSVPESAFSTTVARLPDSADVAALVVWSRIGETASSLALRRVRALGLPVFAAGPGWPTRLPSGVERVRTLPDAVDAVVRAHQVKIQYTPD
ncbi:MAG: MerR family transcriptional regulator [Jatrophihabitans sp.]|uniref:MerR family transcriptional regulator n=1 Tax=Jatrophihabitans sp. TaxID=1932789 RepID=UPI003F7F73CD